MDIRPATSDDDSDLAEVYVASRRVAWRGLLRDGYLDGLDVREEGHALLTYLAPSGEGWRILVAENARQVVGFVTFRREPSSAVGHVGALFVSPRLFRSGIGTALLQAAGEALRDAGCNEAILWTLEDDRNVKDFYERRGWQPDGGSQIIELDQPRTAVRLGKPLPEQRPAQ